MSMSKERLEEFRKTLDFIDDSADMEDYHRFVDTLKNTHQDGELNWIYRYAKEQAERVQELERDYKAVFDLISVRGYQKRLDMMNQNKRYRETLEDITYYTDNARLIKNKARHALESESDE